MTEPIDSQEMLAEYGAIKSVDNVLLKHFIAEAKRQQEIYKSDLERINDVGFELVNFMSISLLEKNILSFVMLH